MALAMEWPPPADGLAVGFGVRGIGRRALFFASVHSWVSSELELGIPKAVFTVQDQTTGPAHTRLHGIHIAVTAHESRGPNHKRETYAKTSARLGPSTDLNPSQDRISLPEDSAHCASPLGESLSVTALTIRPLPRKHQCALLLLAPTRARARCVVLLTLPTVRVLAPTAHH